jgi:GT2 family glycosyltransferase
MDIQISVVIPTHKRPELLLRCLKALSAQYLRRKAYEVIVVADGPDSITEKALAAFNKHRSHAVKYYALPVKKGPAAARNYGWLIAKGELIVFTDDDCIPDKNWLQSYYNRFKADRGTAFTGKTIVPVSATPTDYERNTANLESADFITANCACAKQILFLTGGFDEDFAMAWREDSEFQFKLIKSGIPIVKVQDAVVIHPVRQGEWGVSIKEQKKTLYNALLYKKYPDLYREKIQPSPPVYYYVIITSFSLTLAGLIMKASFLFTAGLVMWLGLSFIFAYRRLKFTSHDPAHLLEMTVTSMLIPFLSIYWQFYGALKYRVFFI